MVTRPKPIIVKLFDGKTRSFYETLPVNDYMIELEKEVAYWKMVALSPKGSKCQ